MSGVWMRLGRAYRRAAGLAAISAMVSGCATTSVTPDGKRSDVAPSNYKQVVTAEIKRWDDASAIQSGQISAPHERWMGLAYGGTRQIVCVMLIKPLLFGNIGPAWYIFYFDNGKPDYIRLGQTSPYAQVGCGDQPMLPFAEMSRRS